MIDESTGVSNVQTLIVYIRTIFDDDVHTYFLGLIPLKIATASAIYDAMMSFCANIGLTDDIFLKQLIGFCSDGASCMTG